MKPAAPPPNQAIYHRFARVYDRLFGALFARARRRAVSLLDLRAGERLFISGVGTGLDLPLIPAGVRVTGVDISFDMLRQAARKPTRAAVELAEMDAQNLTLPPGSFDTALLNLIVSVAPDGAAVLREAWRVLKPGGRLVIFDKFAPQGAEIGALRRGLGWLFRQIGTDINRRLSDVLGDVPAGAIARNEASLFFGQYRILLLRKHGQTF